MTLDMAVKWIGIPGAILATLSVWGILGFPTLATGGDIQRLDRKQAEHAVELYRGKVRNLLIIPTPKEEPAKSIWLEEIETAKRQRDSAEKRQIELSK